MELFKIVFSIYSFLYHGFSELEKKKKKDTADFVFKLIFHLLFFIDSLGIEVEFHFSEGMGYFFYFLTNKFFI